MKRENRVNWQAIPLDRISLSDTFWAPRLHTNRTVTLPIQYEQCRSTGHIDAFRLDWTPGSEPTPHIFWDSDVAKWIEAASYCLITHPDSRLSALLDEVVSLVVSAQQPDGYLNTHFSVVEPEKRWTNLRDCHELYCAGHLMEAAAAHYRATGDMRLLTAMEKYAGLIGDVFGTGPGQLRGYCGHEEIELALIKLFDATGNTQYLDLCRYFVNERGQQPCYFDAEARLRGESPGEYWAGTYAYCQAHQPVREQSEVVGHAVRAMYLYCAMADMARIDHDDSLLDACGRLWNDLTAHKLYITGGIGPSAQNEGFTSAYDLPNDTAYAETCAAIGLVFWCHRMLLLQCDSRYADVMERALYNGVLSGVSLDGSRFFYVNPLQSDGSHQRQEWFGCACCPPNLSRLLASLGGYLYTITDDSLAVHLYAQSEVRMALAGSLTTFRLQTRYPWDGDIRCAITAERAADWSLRLRIPEWCTAPEIYINDSPWSPVVEQGYAVIRRNWKNGDMVQLHLPMPVQMVRAHPDVSADRGLAALQRGPVVYCVEQADHEVDINDLQISRDTTFQTRYDPDLLGGVTVIEAEAQAVDRPRWASSLYLPVDRQPQHPARLTAIPYAVWGNRSAGAMRVWLNRD